MSIIDFVRESTNTAKKNNVKCAIMGFNSSLVMIIMSADDTVIFWSSLMESNTVAWSTQSARLFDVGSGKQAVYIVKPL